MLLRRLSIVAAMFWLFLFSPYFVSKSLAETAVLNVGATADSSTRSQFPNNNYGTSPLSYNFYQSGNQGRSYFKFDMSSIPVGSHVITANLKVFNMANDGQDCNGDPGSFYLSLASSSWQENTLTWNNQPSTSDNSLNPVPCTNGYIYLDFRYIAQEIVDGAKTNNGFIIVNAFGTNFLRTFLTREGAQPPSINILYELPEETPAPAPAAEQPADDQNPTSTPIAVTPSIQTGIKTGTKTAPTVNTSSEILPPSELALEDAANTARAAIKLTWIKSESEGINNYNIYRSEQEGEGFINLAIANKDTAEFIDDSVESGKTYYYFIRSSKGDLESESTETLSLVSSTVESVAQSTPDSKTNLSVRDKYIILGAGLLFFICLLLFYERNWKKKKIDG